MEEVNYLHILFAKAWNSQGNGLKLHICSSCHSYPHKSNTPMTINLWYVWFKLDTQGVIQPFPVWVPSKTPRILSNGYGGWEILKVESSQALILVRLWREGYCYCAIKYFTAVQMPQGTWNYWSIWATQNIRLPQIWARFVWWLRHQARNQ